MKRCRICDSPLEPFLDFGRMPIANGFLAQDQFGEEYFFHLCVGHCETCGMVQLLDQPEPQQMFHENYAYYSSISAHMAAHFKAFAGEARQQYLQQADPLVVEIGSNDGILLQHFATAGVRHLGVEPSANVAEVARRKGVQTVSRFFDESFAKEVVAEHGQADVFLAANVMCHIASLHSVVEGIRILLKPDGVLLFEDPYLGDIVERISYDQFYDEHAFYFSLGSVDRLCAGHGLEVVHVARQDVHGGSMRYTVAHQGRRTTSADVVRLRAWEEEKGLYDPRVYQKLEKDVFRSRDQLSGLLRRLKEDGKRVVGYGATSKSTTVANFCGITADLVEFISDTTPIKQGKFSPGVHLPVRPYSEFIANYPDYALLFAWNHSDEIMTKEESFRRAGGQWIAYVPRVEVRT